MKLSLLPLFLLVNFNLLGQDIRKDSIREKPLIITLDCRLPDRPSATYLIFYENKKLFMPSDYNAGKKEEFLSTINPAMIDSIQVKRNEEAFKCYDLQVESGLIVLYLNSTFKDSATLKILSEFKSQLD